MIHPALLVSAIWVLLVTPAWAASINDGTKHGYFSGHFVSINKSARLLKVLVSFPNMKYLNKRDKVEFWTEGLEGKRCEAYIVGKSDEYLLLKVPQLRFCYSYLMMSGGAYYNFFSRDLVNNIAMGRKVVGTLLKKDLALRGKVERSKRQRDSFKDEIDGVNSRYALLKDKLEAEWRDKLAAIEEDRINHLKEHDRLLLRSAEVAEKLEKYRIDEDNLEEDRWSLDHRLFYKK